jgi:hypothetical protein
MDLNSAKHIDTSELGSAVVRIATFAILTQVSVRKKGHFMLLCAAPTEPSSLYISLIAAFFVFCLRLRLVAVS